MRIGRKFSVPLATAALGLASACAADDSGGDPSTTGPQPSAAASRDSPRCLARQATHASSAGERLQSLTVRVLSAPHRTPDAAVSRFVGAITAVVTETSKACRGGATALAPLAELVRTATNVGLDEPLLRQIVEAFERWGRTVGRPKSTEIIYAADPCTALRKEVHASYEIRRRPEAGGVVAWVELELTVDDWHQSILLSHGGRLEATGVRPDGATRKYRWGASSSDIAEVAPGRTYRGPIDIVPETGPETGDLIQLFPEGDLRVLDAYGSTYVTDSIPCGIAVLPSD